jgi:hypothetical protein
MGASGALLIVPDNPLQGANLENRAFATANSYGYRTDRHFLSPSIDSFCWFSNSE